MSEIMKSSFCLDMNYQLGSQILRFPIDNSLTEKGKWLNCEHKTQIQNEAKQHINKIKMRKLNSHKKNLSHKWNQLKIKKLHGIERKTDNHRNGFSLVLFEGTKPKVNLNEIFALEENLCIRKL